MKEEEFNAQKDKVNRKVIQVILFSFLPVILVIAQNAYIIANAVQEKQKTELVQNAFTFSVKIADIMNKIQEERNASVAYLALEELSGGNSKAMLRKAYQATNMAFDKVEFDEWVHGTDEFRTQNELNSYIRAHRRRLELGNSIENEFAFYDGINKNLARWIAVRLRRVDSDNWLNIVSLRMLIDGKEWASRSLALASVHFLNGSLSPENFLRFINSREVSSSFIEAAADVSPGLSESFQQYTEQGAFRYRQEQEKNVLERRVTWSITKWWLLAHDYFQFLRLMEDGLRQRTQQAFEDERHTQGRRMGVSYAMIIISIAAWLFVVVVTKAFVDKIRHTEIRSMLSKATTKMLGFVSGLVPKLDLREAKDEELIEEDEKDEKSNNFNEVSLE